MRKVRLIVLKSHVENLIRDLHEAGVVDIRKTRHNGLDEGRPLASFDVVSAELLRLRSALSLMESVLGKRRPYEPKAIEGQKALQQARTLSFEDQLKRLNSEITSLSENIRNTEIRMAALEKLSHFNVDFSRLSSRSLNFRAGEIAPAKVPKLREGLGKMNADLVMESGKSAVLVLFERKRQQQVESALSEAGFADIELPEGTMSPAETMERLVKERESSTQRLASLKNELAAIAKSNVHRVQDLIHSLEIEASRAEVSTRFAESKKAFVIEGWVLDDDFPGMGPLAEKHQAVIQDAGYDAHHEMPPTVLDNPKAVKEFEFITKSYSLPKYHEIDPTIPYFIGLTIIYGMIVGDVIYGLISMALAYFIMKRYSRSELMRPIATIWLISAIPTIAWGLIFDEWMGLTHQTFFNWIGSFIGIAVFAAPLYSGFHRVHELSMLILATLFLGMIHMAFGLVLGAINEWNHSRKHAFAKIGWLVLEAGIALALLSALNFVGPEMLNAALAMCAGGAVVVIVTEGANGAVELPGFAGNILSYSRIAVIGVVGVILAEILNEFLRPSPAQGLMALVLLPVYLGLHFANCIIAMFEALVQGGRLNIFEFRTKAIHGGGTLFAPFAVYSKKL